MEATLLFSCVCACVPVYVTGKALNPDTAKAVQQRVLAGSKGADGRAATQLRPEQMKVRDCPPCEAKHQR